MFLPTHSSLNVDMEWMNRVDSPSDVDITDNPNEVDIGFIPQMKIVSNDLAEKNSLTPVSKRSVIEELNSQKLEDGLHSKSISVTDEMLAGSLKMLENQFYSFKSAVEYLSFPDAVEAASASASDAVWKASSASQKKPLHAILLWGSLDDQSC